MTPLHQFELILGLLGVALVLPMVTARLPVPPAGVLVLGGMALAIIPGAPTLELDPDLILVLFLPPLLLASAYFTVWRDFRKEWRPILLLAIGAVAFTTAAVGWATKLLMPSLPWSVCFALGAIVSPPDAVAAKAVLHGLPLPRRVVTILEGESLVNDASGLLLFRLAIGAALTGVFSIKVAAVSFAWLAAGGAGLGYVLGRATVWALSKRKHPQEVLLLGFLASWVSYIGADLLGTSGVLSVVACGLVLGWYQHETLTAQGRTQARAVWRFVVSMLESLVFVLIGLSLRGVLNRFGGLEAALQAAGPITAAVILTVVIARLVWVFPGVYLPRWLSPALRVRDPAPPPAIAWVIGWAGMRGVVSLAAALSLPREIPGRDVLLFVTFGVIAATVLLQGSTLAPLIRRFVKPQADPVQQAHMDEYAARAHVTAASLRFLEAQPVNPESGAPKHPQLLEEYRRRTHVTRRVREQEDHLVDVRREHFAAALLVLEAGRLELIQLHRRGLVHDSVLHALEAELDLEELRIRRLAGDTDEE
jgi:CPA1 family monovalent cation:H+ antiporter